MAQRSDQQHPGKIVGSSPLDLILPNILFAKRSDHVMNHLIYDVVRYILGSVEAGFQLA